ncbi:hypothetical protein TNCV_620581 [Trichonephila clavipes]|nr:hypothetical protein TNCV_620581 [Trichonephila clavipes]
MLNQALPGQDLMFDDYVLVAEIVVWGALSDAEIVALKHNNTESDEDESEELTSVTLSEAKVSLNKLRNTSKSWTATAGLDVVQSGRLIFDVFFQHLWPYIGNDTANVVFQMVKRLWLIRIDQ